MNDQLITSVVKKVGIVTLSLLSLFLLAKVFTEFKKLGEVDNNSAFYSITVSGKGEVFAISDIATFSFTVKEEGKTVGEAQEKAEAKISRANTTLKEAGIEEKDIKTINYSGNPKYEYNPKTFKSTIVGYELSQTVSVKIRDTGKAGDILGKIGAIGVSNLSDLSFTVDNEDELKKEARDKAIVDAKEKAKVLAKGLGVKLKGVTSFYENEAPVYGPYYDYKASGGMGGGAAPVSVSIPRGENKIEVNVSVTYRIK